MKIVELSQIRFQATSHAPIDKIKKKVIFPQGQIPHLTQFAQGYFQPGSSVPKHKHHDLYEIFLIEKGEIEFTVNNQKFILKKGEAIVIDPKETHQLKNKNHQTAVLTYFSILK